MNDYWINILAWDLVVEPGSISGTFDCECHNCGLVQEVDYEEYHNGTSVCESCGEILE